jgi:hypothetical protein
MTRVAALVVIAALATAPTSPGPRTDIGIDARALGKHVRVTGHETSAAAPTGPTSGPPIRTAERLPQEQIRARTATPIPCYQPGATTCAQNGQVCESTTDGAPRTLYWIFTGPPGVANPTADQWLLTATQCLTTDETDRNSAQPPAIVVTAEDLRKLPLPAGAVHVQPGNGRTLINVPTNVYVQAGTVTIPTTVLGRPVQVRATPVSYDWAFGDGERLRTADPGAPYPELRTTHTYRAAGTVRLGLVTTYRGEFSVDGGPWQPVDGTAAVASPAQPLVVVRARTELVQDALPT